MFNQQCGKDMMAIKKTVSTTSQVEKNYKRLVRTTATGRLTILFILFNLSFYSKSARVHSTNFT